MEWVTTCILVKIIPTALSFRCLKAPPVKKCGDRRRATERFPLNNAKQKDIQTLRRLTIEVNMDKGMHFLFSLFLSLTLIHIIYR